MKTNEKLGQEPAFAISGNDYSTERGNKYHPKQEGMSKRFYAACAAMQGMLANDTNGNAEVIDIIKWAYELSDELLKQENL